MTGRRLPGIDGSGEAADGVPPAIRPVDFRQCPAGGPRARDRLAAFRILVRMTLPDSPLRAPLFGTVWFASLYSNFGGNIPAGLKLPLAEISRLKTNPHQRSAEPYTAVPVESRSGPIVLTIEHPILAKDIEAFLAVMNERRRIRRRDGPHDWSQLRDLAEPTLWIERFHFATWLDDVRHNQRRTRADTRTARRCAACGSKASSLSFTAGSNVRPDRCLARAARGS